MYLQKADYKGRISLALLDILISEDPDNILVDSSKVAEDTITSLAGMLYDVAGELEKEGAQRNHFVLKMALSIALYNIYQIADDEEVPQKVIKNYDDTMEDLIKISTGKMNLSLPPKPVADGTGSAGGGDGETASTTGTGLRRMGSQPKRTHNI